MQDRVINPLAKWFRPGSACFIAAEIGINHNGDMRLAQQLIDAAADAGADAVKFQNYRTEDFISDRSLTYEYVSQGRTVIESQYEMFKRCEINGEWITRLKAHAAQRGVIFFSTPTAPDGLEILVRAGVPLLKNGSDYLTHLPLIRAMARTGLPTVISTGMASLAEIEEAVLAHREAGGQGLVLLHCVSAYPTPDSDVHLRKIPALAAKFGCAVGISDHSEGMIAALGAVAHGALMIEKHFTLNHDLPGPDHRFSSDPRELAELVKAVRRLEAMLGKPSLGYTETETESRTNYRLSCVAARALAEGQRVEPDAIVFRRPGHGIPPKGAEGLTGRMLRHGVPAGHVFRLEDFV
jgi:N-acetylneuraminate synthase/N,N'-diacetyllegionaminate synthase